MKLVFSAAAFAEAARAIRHIPSTSMQVDILDHARLEARGEAMSLTMSCLELEARVTLACGEVDQCLAAIPAAVLEFFVIRGGKDGEEGSLEFDERMTQVTARHGRARMTMPILPGEDFPLLAEVKPSWTISLRAHEICRAFKRTERALAVEESRLWATGAFLHQGKNGLVLVGSDGNRLHLIELGIDKPDKGKLPAQTAQGADALSGIIIPPRAMKEIGRIFAGDESAVTLAGTDRMMVLEGERIRIASKLVDATYFDYTRAVPPLPEPRVTISADRLVNAIDGLLVVPKTEGKGKKATQRAVTITLGEASIGLKARGDVGDAEDEIEAECHGAEPGTEITFNAQFLNQVIEAADAKTVSLHPPTETGKPFLLTGAEGALFVIGQRRP